MKKVLYKFLIFTLIVVFMASSVLGFLFIYLLLWVLIPLPFEKAAFPVSTAVAAVSSWGMLQIIGKLIGKEKKHESQEN